MEIIKHYFILRRQFCPCLYGCRGFLGSRTWEDIPSMLHETRLCGVPCMVLKLWRSPSLPWEEGGAGKTYKVSVAWGWVGWISSSISPVQLPNRNCLQVTIKGVWGLSFEGEMSANSVICHLFLDNISFWTPIYAVHCCRLLIQNEGDKHNSKRGEMAK